MTIQNPFASHLTERQHSKLAAHYIRRYHWYANQFQTVGSTCHAVEDSHTIFLKYLYHNRRKVALRKAAREEREQMTMNELRAMCAEGE